MIDQIAREVESRTGIKTDVRSIQNVLLAVEKYSDFWEIVRASSEPYNLVAEAIKVMVDKGLIKVTGQKIVLTEAGFEKIKREGIGKGNYTCDKCAGRGIIYELLGEDVIKQFREIAEKRPEAIKQYDQGYVTVETTLARIAFMDHKGDLRGKNLLILGDDDLMSVAAMITGWPKKITVFEIDERLVNFIKKTGEEFGYDIEVYQHDLRKPLPEKFKGKFDTFFTDPVETLIGLKAFIGRGISALRGERSAGYFGLTLVDSSLYKWRDLQKVLVVEFGAVITDIIKDFSEYVNWGYIEEMSGWEKAPVKSRPKINWYTSTLYRIEVLRGFKGFEEVIEGDIYYDEETASV